MSTPLKRYLAKLATDAGFFERHTRDRDALMKESCLSEADRAALNSHDATLIMLRLDAEEGERTGPAPGGATLRPTDEFQAPAEILVDRSDSGSTTVAVLVAGVPVPTPRRPGPVPPTTDGLQPPVTHY